MVERIQDPVFYKEGIVIFHVKGFEVLVGTLVTKSDNDTFSIGSCSVLGLVPLSHSVLSVSGVRVLNSTHFFIQ